MTTIPPGAFQDAADHLTRAVKREDGKDVTAFGQQAKALAAMRTETIAQANRIAQLEQKVAALPFPFGAGS